MPGVAVMAALHDLGCIKAWKGLVLDTLAARWLQAQASWFAKESLTQVSQQSCVHMMYTRISFWHFQHTSSSSCS